MGLNRRDAARRSLQPILSRWRGVTGSGKRHELPGQRGLVINGAETRSPPPSGCTCVCLCGVHLCGSCTVYSVHRTPWGRLLGGESFNLKTRGGSAAVEMSACQKRGGRKSSWGLLSAATPETL